MVRGVEYELKLYVKSMGRIKEKYQIKLQESSFLSSYPGFSFYLSPGFSAYTSLGFSAYTFSAYTSLDFSPEDTYSLL